MKHALWTAETEPCFPAGVLGSTTCPLTGYETGETGGTALGNREDGEESRDILYRDRIFFPPSLLFTRFTGSTGSTCCEEGLSGLFPLV